MSGVTTAAGLAVAVFAGFAAVDLCQGSQLQPGNNSVSIRSAEMENGFMRRKSILRFVRQSNFKLESRCLPAQKMAHNWQLTGSRNGHSLRICACDLKLFTRNNE
jgi:hypothetical protein